jgi:hypothetical protein
MKKLPWYDRLIESLGLAPRSWQARNAVRGTSKHERAEVKRHDWARWRKVRRKMAAESRRRNRQYQ